MIRGNGLGYYAWLRSLLIDHDWDFANEFDEHAVPGDWVPPASYCTPIGRRANQWSVGPACVWAITVVPLHFLLVALGESSPWRANGYSLPYQVGVGVTSLSLAIVGLFLLYGICRHYARANLAALAAILLTLGSTLVYYGSVEVSMAHGLGAVALAALVWYWLKTYGSLRFARWFTLGMLLGLTALMRWQLATFAVLPVGEALLTLRTRRHHAIDWQFVLHQSALLLVSATGVLLAFLPQMIAWRCVYGHWLVEPVPRVTHHWLAPSFWDLLLSQDRSLFYWTPITAVACLGFAVRFLPRICGRPHATLKNGSRGSSVSALGPTVPLALLFTAFGVQVYALGSVWGRGEFLEEVGNFGGAFLSKAYGMRQLTEVVVALAPGLALLLDRVASASPFRLRFVAPFPLLGTLAFSLTLWNLMLVLLYTERLVPVDGGLGPQGLLLGAGDLVKRDMGSIALLVEALGLIYFVLLWANSVSGPSIAAEHDS